MCKVCPNFPNSFVGWAAVALLATCLACGGSGGGGVTPPLPAQPYVRSATLSGTQEAPSNPSVASGTGSISVDPTTRAITGTLTTAGVAATAAHIHEGVKGVAGSVVIPLSGGAGGVWTVPSGTVLTEAQFTSLKANNFYFNAHSAAYPAGEIRGQIELRVRFASMAGSQEVPPVTSTATGSGALSLNTATGEVSGSLNVSGIAGTAAHIHEAASGVAGSVIIPLTDAGGGLWKVPPGSMLSASQMASFEAGNLYFNVHTAANPGGEIRGQLNIATALAWTTVLAGTQEVPPNGSVATGTGTLSVNPVTRELSGAVITTGLVGTASHIHEAAAGIAGAVIVPLVSGGAGVWVVPAGSILTDAQFTSLRAGNLYFNVHSAAYPGGEIRGQIGATSGGGGSGSGGSGY